MQSKSKLKQESEVERDITVAVHYAVFVLTKCLHCKADQDQGIYEALSDYETNIIC